MEKEIKIIIDDGGQISGICVSKDLKDADVEIVDMCTDDATDFKKAKKREKEVLKAVKNKTLIEIY